VRSIILRKTKVESTYTPQTGAATLAIGTNHLMRVLLCVKAEESVERCNKIKTRFTSR